MRWFENHLQDIEELEFSDEEDNAVNGKQKKNVNELEEDNQTSNLFSSIAKSWKALQLVATDQSESKEVRKIKILVNSLLVVLISLAFIEFFVSSN